MATKITGTNTAAAPGVTGDDTDTGLFYGTNEIGFSTGGTSRATIDSSGRLLVNNTDPSVVHSNADDVVIGNTSASLMGLSLVTSTSGYATLQFSDGAGDKNQGQIAYNHADNSLAFTANSNQRLTIDSSGRFLKGVTSSEGSRSNTSVRQPHFQLSSPWSSGLGSTSITCTNDYPIIFINSNAGFSDNSGAGVITWSVKDGAGNYCNTASINSQIDGTPGNNDSPGELNFLTTPDGTCQPQTRMTLGSGGDLNILDGNLKVADGHGIDFSATSGTGDSELLDDYERGTFTPVLGGSTNHGSYNITGDGHYVKIGKMVNCHIAFSNKDLSDSAGGTVRVAALPFTSAAVQYTCTTSHYMYHVDFNTSRIQSWYMHTGSTEMDGIESVADGGWVSWPVTDFNRSGMYLRIQMTYLVA